MTAGTHHSGDATARPELRATAIGGEARIKFGALLWPQYTDWASIQAAGAGVDALGFDSLWTWDHLYPIAGDPHGPIFEGYLTLAGWAAVTARVRLGLMVAANTFRNPAITAKLVTTLDHMSGGRANLGIGAAWFEKEHTAYGIDFGSGFGERLDWLDEAVDVVRAMLDGVPKSARGPSYRMTEVRNVPSPIQPRLPIYIGGGGEQKTLRTVAKYADGWNLAGSIDLVRHKDQVLRDRCAEIGRDPNEIERTFAAEALIIRDDPNEGQEVADETGRLNGGWRGPALVGSSAEIVEYLLPFVELGFRHIYFDVPAPYDDETLERLVTEVRPGLVARAGL